MALVIVPDNVCARALIFLRNHRRDLVECHSSDASDNIKKIPRSETGALRMIAQVDGLIGDIEELREQLKTTNSFGVSVSDQLKAKRKARLKSAKKAKRKLPRKK